jgi:hypothetical protein
MLAWSNRRGKHDVQTFNVFGAVASSACLVGRMSRGWLRAVWIGAASVLVLAGCIYFLGKVAGPAATSPSAPSGAQASGAPTSSPGATAVVGSPALTQAQADAIASTFASGDTARVAAVLADGVRAEYEASPGPVLSPGESLSIRAADVRVTGVGRAAGLVGSHGAAGPTRWALGLVLQKGEWKVLMMVKAGTP